MSLAITGASGQLGRLTADALLARVPASDVVLVTRNPEALTHYAARGATVRAGDFDDPASLPAAFAGVERLLLISTDAGGARVTQHRAAIDAAVAAGVGSVVYTSIVNPSDSNPVAVGEEHRTTEELLRASGLGWTFLREAVYAETLVQSARGAIAAGQLATNEADGRCAYVSRADIAAAAAVVLSSDGHVGRTYDITGPEALGARELAALYGEISGTPVEPVFLDDTAYAAALVEHAGLPEPAARFLATFGEATREGYLAPTSTTVEDLTGRAPRSVREVLHSHRAELTAVPA